MNAEIGGLLLIVLLFCWLAILLLCLIAVVSRINDRGGAVSKQLEQRIDRLRDQRDRLVKALTAARHALESYAVGNSSPELAKSVAAHLETLLAEIAKEMQQ